MSQQEDERSGGGGFAWFLVGAAIGAVCAALYTPKSGKDTRDFLASKAQQGKDALSGTYEKSRQLVDDAAGLFERGRKLVSGERSAQG